MKPKVLSIKGLWLVLKDTFKEYRAKDPGTLGSALSYVTLFSLAPILIIIISIAGLAFGHEAVQGEIKRQIEGSIGSSAAIQVQSMIKAAYHPGEGILATVLAGILLILGALGVFSQLKTSLNTLWEIKPKPKLGIKRYILDRVLSFGMLVCIGFLLLVSLVVQSVLVALTNYMVRTMPNFSVFIVHFLDLVFSFLLTFMLLALTYKFMSDAKIKWKYVWVGALFTAVLFSAGKYLISYALGRTNYSNTYGAAGSVVLVLVWVFYSSHIFFFGAQFTRAFALHNGSNIIPKEYAVRNTTVEVEQKPNENHADFKKKLIKTKKVARKTTRTSHNSE